MRAFGAKRWGQKMGPKDGAKRWGQKMGPKIKGQHSMRAVFSLFALRGQCSLSKSPRGFKGSPLKKLKTLYSKASEKTNHGCRCYRTLGDSCGVEMSPLALLLFIGT
jgi:hypothetical protein